MNDADSRYLASELEQLGYVWTPDLKQADLAILNTCVVRQHAEDKIYGCLGSLKKTKNERPEMTVALMGCLVGVDKDVDLKRRFPIVDVLLSPSETEPLIAHLAEYRANGNPQLLELRDRTRRDRFLEQPYDLPTAGHQEAVTAYVPAVLGCSHACAFCVIPGRRGPERSRPKDSILQEVRALAAQGVKEVTLLGQIVDRYGTDLDDGTDLANLLAAVAGVDALYRVRFLTGHPNWMTDQLLDAVATVDKVCPHIELAVQAGNNDVLQRMRRGYTIDKYRATINRIRERVPEAAIHTDIIVGFPGESDEQFMDSYRLLEELRFDKVHIAKYSVRPTTYAAERYEDDVPEEEKERRRKMLEDLERSILEEKNSKLLGETVEVLVEDKHRNRWRGRTPQNKLVFFEDDRDLRGQLVNVVVEWAGPYSLVGSPAD